MKYELIKPINREYSTVQQVLTNRDIALKDIEHYLNTTDNDINSFEGFGLDKLSAATQLLFKCISKNSSVVVVVDADCDGFTSAAIIINYLYDILPNWAENHLLWLLHDGKQHGLADLLDNILLAKDDVSLVICPDAASNDVKEHAALAANNIDVICLDHHLVEVDETPNAIVINNQNSNYPNKHFSGAGVTWQFCRYLDKVTSHDFADCYLDLCALGNCADVMDTHDFETKHLINKGFERRHLHNPFIRGMAEKNKFKLGTSNLTFMGVAFYIAPFVNAIVRSGTEQEKELVFHSMLDCYAFREIPSNKRGHKLNEMETVLEQALRTVTNVKNRQTKVQDSMMEMLEQRIKEDNMLENKVLLFLMKPGEIDKNVAGLVANKLMSKYQRPCAILTEGLNPDSIITYAGSARGYDKSGINSFKEICNKTEAVDFTAGHDNAFGLGVPRDQLDKFITKSNELLKDMKAEPVYRVDYIWNSKIDKSVVEDIGSMAAIWSSSVDEPLVAIENITFDKSHIFIYKGNTIKIMYDGVAIMLFNTNEDVFRELCSENGETNINIVAKCNLNEWQGTVTPQLFIEDFEINSKGKFLF